jgi:hypothetical protein
LIRKRTESASDETLRAAVRVITLPDDRDPHDESDCNGAI